MLLKSSKYLTILSIIALLNLPVLAQNQNQQEQDYFSVRGSVKESDTHQPIQGVTIQINGGKYTQTDITGAFTIMTKVGDELMVTHPSFDPIYYTIKNNERISIKVVPARSKWSKNLKRKSPYQNFNSLIDSADTYLKSNAQKSIGFIGDALKQSNSATQNAEAYQLLADVYSHLKQYDLAISQYKISLQNQAKNATKLKLAKAYFNNNEVDKSILEYQALKSQKLSNYQQVQLYEGLGDAYKKNKEFSKAIAAYQEGLQIAKEHLIAPKITDLNAKIAQAYNAKGEVNEAENYYKNTLKLAQKENKKRAVEAQLEVADFNNSNLAYDDEINLRKQALPILEDIENDSIITNESPLTLQKQNYKIGNAYALKNDYSNAIPYYEKSIKEADKRGDLVVKKDALRKLSDAQYNSGNTEAAFKTINEFKNVVDVLYIEKQQEIERAARFNKQLAAQQNRIASLESDRKLSQSQHQLTKERNKRQQWLIYSLIAGLLLLLVAGYFMYQSIKQQKLANNLLALKSLRSQMNPHFIFNALNSVNSFIAANNERTANKYLSDFSQLMRSVLENSEQDFIPLKKEIELIERYTKLEHFRFQDKFDYNISVDNAIDVDEFQIPPMLLQPYIENAVWHGLRYKDTKGHLQISFQKKTPTQILITITDNGIGRTRSKALKTANQKKQNSKGMSNIKKRINILNQMYKDKVDVFINDNTTTENDVGTKVEITLRKD